jgi:hypothetical protein
MDSHKQKQQSPQKCPKCGNTENLTIRRSLARTGPLTRSWLGRRAETDQVGAEYPSRQNALRTFGSSWDQWRCIV